MKRSTLRICVFLLLGAIVNVAVAWGFALWTTANAGDMEFEAAPDAKFAWGATWATTLATPTPIWCSRSNVGRGLEMFSLQLCAPGHPGYESPRALHITRAGLPWRCLMCVGYLEETSALSSPSANATWQGGFAASAFLQPRVAREGWPRPYARPLPTSPLWPGFALNTVFYAAILWMLFAAPFALRRRRRIKRGLCAQCAYDLRGHGGPADAMACPECGAPR